MGFTNTHTNTHQNNLDRAAARRKKKRRERRAKLIREFIQDDPNGTLTIYWEIGLIFWLFMPKKIYSIMPFKNGKLHGEYKRFYPNGKIECISNYKDGVLDGLTTFYFRHTDSYQLIPYKNSKIHGERKTFNGSGGLEQVEVYDEDTLIKKTNYENGKPYYKAENEGRAYIEKSYFKNGNTSLMRVVAPGDGWHGKNNIEILNNGHELANLEFFKNGNLKKIEIFKDASTFDWNKWIDDETNVYDYGDTELRPSGTWWTCEEFYKNGNKKKLSSYCIMGDVFMGRELVYEINRYSFNGGYEIDVRPVGKWSWFNNDGTLRRTEEFVVACCSDDEAPVQFYNCYYLPREIALNQDYINKIRKTKKYFVDDFVDDFAGDKYDDYISF